MNQAAIKLLLRYQDKLSPHLAERGVHCIYEQTCSQYAIEAYKSKGFLLASALVVMRLLSCNPINAFWKERTEHGERI